jgi:hypothetical protein
MFFESLIHRNKATFCLLPNAVAQSAHEDIREPFSLNQMGSPSVALEAKTVLSVE